MAAVPNHNQEAVVHNINDRNEHEHSRNQVYIDERRRVSAADLANQLADGNPRFGVVRDRLFHAMLVRLSLPYYINCPVLVRRIIEFVTLVNAITLLIVLIYMHFLLATYPANCMGPIMEKWPKKGIVRVEVIKNLEEFKEAQMRREKASPRFCHFDLAEILRTGKLPIEIQRQISREQVGVNAAATSQNGLPQYRIKIRRLSMPALMEIFLWIVDLVRKLQTEFIGGNTNIPESDIYNKSEVKRMDGVDSNNDENYDFLEDEKLPLFHQIFEFSIHYGLLRLPAEMREELDLDVLVVQLDPERDECFKDWRQQPFMRYLVGLEELVMASIKQLSENETDRGYLRDLIGGELYHFVTVGQPNISQYLTALTLMLIFTFAISMLLRFSHDQIFVFIVDLFQMFEQNQPLFFPIAPLLTVILALVGMEAIMSEIFNDTSTAFYVILLVWMADQYDAIFCHSSIGRRYWLRFFYVYHLFFYLYQYRYSGLYSGLALLTSAAFTFHSMVYFFHHFELPHIIYQQDLARAVQVLQNTNEGGDTVDVLRVRRILRATRRNNQNGSTTNGTANERPAVRLEDRHQENSIRLAISAILEVENRFSSLIASNNGAQLENAITAEVNRDELITVDPELLDLEMQPNQSPEEIVANSTVEEGFREAMTTMRNLPNL